MLTKRNYSLFGYKDGLEQLKGTNFIDLRVQVIRWNWVRLYAKQGADELVF